jgi:hypothetical protein
MVIRMIDITMVVVMMIALMVCTIVVVSLIMAMLNTACEEKSKQKYRPCYFDDPCLHDKEFVIGGLKIMPVVQKCGYCSKSLRTRYGSDTILNILGLN